MTSNRDEELAQILADLRDVGIYCSSLEELRGSGTRYPQAVPVLLRWLPRVDDRRRKESIARTLTVPWAKPAAAGPILDEFRRVRNEDDPHFFFRWALANALEVVADDSYFDELARIAKDAQFGIARQMIVLALGKSRRPEAEQVLVSLLDDGDVNGHALDALRRLARRNVLSVPRSRIAEKLTDDRAWVRKEAKKLLEKLDAASEA